MAKITDNTKQTLLDILSKNNNPEEPATTLPAPIKVNDYRFLQRYSGGTYKKILKLFFYKDLVIQYVISYKNPPKIEYEFLIYRQPIVGRYETHLHWTVGKYETLEGDKGLPEFKELKLTDDGVFYGLAKINDKTHFVKFHGFLEDDNYQDYKKLHEQLPPKTIYPDAIFDIETVINTEEFDDTKRLDVPLGDAAFSFGDGGYDKIDFNRDVYDKNKFAFALWQKSNRWITMVQFVILRNNINSIRQTEFIINEAISLTEGTDLPGSNFAGISTIGVLTGDTKTADNKVNKGSIIFSTEKDAGEDKEVAFANNYPHQNLTYRIRSLNHKFWLPTSNSYLFQTDLAQTIIDNTQMQKILDDLRAHIAAKPVSLDYKLVFEFFYTNGTSRTVTYPKIFIDRLLNATRVWMEMIFHIEANNKPGDEDTDIEIEFKPRVNLFYDLGDGVERSASGSWTGLYTRKGNITAKAGGVASFGVNLRDTFEDHEGGDLKYNPELDVRFWTSQRNPQPPAENTIFIPRQQYNDTYSVLLQVSGKTLQRSVKENNTSQIKIIEDPGAGENDKPISYIINMSENNSYEGSAPIFINPKRVLIPLKSKETNEYSIFDFNEDKSETTEVFERFYNEVATSSATLTLELLDPTSVVQVLVNNQVYDEENYTFDGAKNEIAIRGLSNKDQVSVRYRTRIRKPSKIENSFNTISDNFQIAAVSNKDELPTSFPSIVGAFDNNNNKNEVFNLYDSYAKIVKNDSSENTGVKKFVYGYRQKNILWIATAKEDQYREWLDVAVWQQIYAETDDPYLKLPYSANAKNLNLARVNIQEDEFKNSRFDNRFLDITTHANITVATTTAGVRDLTSGGNRTVIFGNTNKPVLEFARQIDKDLNEVKDINVNVEVAWVDEGKGTNQAVSNKLALLFDGTKTINLEDLGIDRYEVWTDKGTKWQNGKITSDNITASVKDGTINIEFEFIHIPKGNTRVLGNINIVKIFSSTGIVLSEDTIVPCYETMIFRKQIRIVSE